MSAEEEVKASDFNFAGSNFMHDAVNSWCAPHYLRLPTTRQWKEMKIEGKRNAYLAVIMELTDSL